MNKITKLIAGLLLLAAALIGIYAVILARQPAPVVAPAAPTAAASPVNQFAVVVVTKPLQAGKPIPVDSVRVEKLPIKPVESFADSAEVIGKIPVVDLGEGMPLLQTHLSGGLAGQVGEGERAVAVNIDESISVGNRIKPGDFVDVFFLLKQDNSEITPSQARLLLSRLRVLAMGSTSVNEDPVKSADAAANAAKVPPRTAVLSVPIGEINKLNLAQNSGRLTLALRNPKDEGVPSESLFPVPPPVIQARDFKAGATDPVSGKVLTKELASEPVNMAYAGTSLAGLSGNKDNKPVRPGVASGNRTTLVIETVEIIRGGVRQ